MCYKIRATNLTSLSGNLPFGNMPSNFCDSNPTLVFSSIVSLSSSTVAVGGNSTFTTLPCQETSKTCVACIVLSALLFSSVRLSTKMEQEASKRWPPKTYVVATTSFQSTRRRHAKGCGEGVPSELPSLFTPLGGEKRRILGSACATKKK